MDASNKSGWCGPSSGVVRENTGEMKSPQGDFDSQTLEFMAFGYASEEAAIAGAGLEYDSTHPDYPTQMWAVEVSARSNGNQAFKIIVDYKGCVMGLKLKRREATQQEIVVWTETDQRGTATPEDDQVTGFQLMIPATVVVDTYCTLIEPSANSVGTNVTPTSAPFPALVPPFNSSNIINYVPSGWVLQSREKEAVGPNGGTAFVVTDTYAYYDPSGRPGALNSIVNAPAND